MLTTWRLFGLATYGAFIAPLGCALTPMQHAAYRPEGGSPP